MLLLAGQEKDTDGDRLSIRQWSMFFVQAHVVVFLAVPDWTEGFRDFLMRPVPAGSP